MSKFHTMSPEVIIALQKRPVDIGSPFGKTDLHHAVLSKASVRGLPPEEQAKIHDPRNILKIEHGLHLHKPIPEGIDAALLLYDIYGRESVLEWFESIQWRNKPPFELP